MDIITIYLVCSNIYWSGAEDIIGHHNLAFSVLKYIFMGVEEIFRDLTHIYFVRIGQTLGPDPLTFGS